MTGLVTCPYTTSHISLKSQVFSSLLTTWCDPQRSVSPWSAWRPEAPAPRRSRPRWACRNRQRSAGCGGRARTATWRRATSGDRVVGAGLCVHVLLHVSTHISRRVMCAPRLWVHSCNEERVLAAALINAWMSVEPCCTGASVRKRLQASVMERGAIVSAHFFLAIFGANIALPQIKFKPSVERRVRFWRIFWHFFHPVTPEDLAVAQHFKDRCTGR